MLLVGGKLKYYMEIKSNTTIRGIGMPYLANKNECKGCSACVSACRRRCLQMKTDAYGFAFPFLMNPNQCVHCRKCEKTCPVLRSVDTMNREPEAYAAYSLDEMIRLDSSSGGVFTEISVSIIKDEGCIWGASYNNNFAVEHICIETEAELWKLRGAKYAQSKMNDCFRKVKTALERGRKVLFSGTPCQVAGLRSFLQKDYDNLLCIDFVCHGVPSPMVWEKYVQYRANADNNGTLPRYINLRCKDSGWSRYSYSVDFHYQDATRYICRNSEDIFMRLFINDYILRKSCSACQFKGYNRVSDITLGDFWGIWDIKPEMDDNKGTSLVLIHSLKGKNMLNSISNKIMSQQVTLEQASRMNRSLLQSSAHKTSREEMLDTIADNGFQFTQASLQQKNNLTESIINKTRRIVKKLFSI